MHVVFISSMVLIQSYLNADLCRCEYIKYFHGLGKDEKLFKYKWLFKILLLMLDSFPKSAELNQGRRNPPALNYIKERLFPPFFTRVNGDFNLLLIRRGVESKVNVVAIAGAETDGVFEEICNTAHRDCCSRKSRHGGVGNE